MIYTNATKKAMHICFEAHRDQLDKSGIPYVFHPIHLAEQMMDEDTTIVALLHDVMEDTDYTLQMLRDEGFSEEVLEALVLLTHKDEENYLDYVKRIKDNPIAKAVKLADLKHNSDLTRLNMVDEIAVKRKEKYQEAMALLNS